MNAKIKNSIEKMGEYDIPPHLLTVIHFLLDKVEKMEEEIETLRNTTVKREQKKVSPYDLSAVHSLRQNRKDSFR